MSNPEIPEFGVESFLTIVNKSGIPASHNLIRAVLPGDDEDAHRKVLMVEIMQKLISPLLVPSVEAAQIFWELVALPNGFSLKSYGVTPHSTKVSPEKSGLTLIQGGADVGEPQGRA